MENRILEDSQYKDTDADVVEKYGTRKVHEVVTIRGFQF